ncbi:Prepilin-type N-terminal cleavage/methylation domain-containing protein [Pseudomonas sp. 8AS]|uniref:PilW family protein n=1 Tax=Pseudomonas sp. 8AS TaxID=2653163 RepID=UPI0012F2A0C3|nr:PilW family protein [Pseudomonas sp. 8AS]VXC06808.1 Prepilin-type N-terminal cleavage/methylation domain-containing protein [Pseudomonas sp. 8AS]
MKHSLTISPSHGGRRQAGLSLIELMVAMAIALLMMGAILQLFLDVTRTNDDMERTNAQIESGRFTFQAIGQGLLHAGFWDGYVPEYDDLASKDIPTGYPASFLAPDPCLAYASWTAQYRDNLLRMPVQSFAAVPSGCTGVIQDHKANSDILVVRHADTAVTATPDGSKVYLQVSYCNTASTYDYVLAKEGFSMTRRDCSTAAATRRYVANIYYLRNDNTLMRAEYVGGASEWNVQPLVDGVEGLVVELGIDHLSDSGAEVNYASAITWADPLNKVSPTNRGDGAPDGGFVRCPAAGCSADQLINVVAAKLHVLVRATKPSPGYTDSKTYNLGAVALGPFNDSIKRHAYTTAVRLNNVSARRETP